MVQFGVSIVFSPTCLSAGELIVSSVFIRPPRGLLRLKLGRADLAILHISRSHAFILSITKTHTHTYTHTYLILLKLSISSSEYSGTSCSFQFISVITLIHSQPFYVAMQIGILSIHNERTLHKLKTLSEMITLLRKRTQFFFACK